MKIAYVFPGQGAQYVGMGRNLAEAFPVAAEVFRTADEVLGYSVQELCFDGPEETLNRTVHTQPALLTTSVAALKSFESVLGDTVRPDFVAGHSLGEYSACVAAGALRLEDAIRLVRNRGTWMDEAVPAGQGSMAAVLGMDADALAEVCRDASVPGDSVELANVNCPGQIVISGGREAVARAAELAKAAGAKRAIILTVSGPFHSSLMRPAADQLGQALQATPFSDADVPVVANVDASFNRTPAQLRQALEAQLCSAVQWEMCVRAMMEQGVGAFVEIGPGSVLSGLIRKIDRGIPTFRVEDEASLMETAKSLRDLVHAS